MPATWPARRVALALATCAALVLVPAVLQRLEAMYPLAGSPTMHVARYAVAGLAAWLISAATLGAWMAPAWLIALRWRPDDTFVVRSFRALIIAFALQPAVHGIVLLAAGMDAPTDRYRFVALVAQGAVWIACAFVAPRAAASPQLDRGRLTTVAAYSLLFTLVVTPRLLWADLIADGLEVLMMGRSLASHVLPRFWTGEFPDVDLVMITASYPVDWVIAVGGLSDVAARMPLLGYVVVLALAVLALAEYGTARALQRNEVATLFAMVGAVGLVQSFNASYDAYASDLGALAGTDLLAMVFTAATLYFIVAGERGWVVASAAMLALTRPSGPVIFGLLLLAVLVVERDVRSPRLRGAAMALATVVLVSIVHASFEEDGGGAFLTRVRYLRFDDWRRILFLLLPSGVMPVLALFRWRRLDGVARSIALLAIGYFGFFFVLAFVSLHHFLPAMALPIVAFWRSEAQRATAAAAGWRLAVAAGAALALATSLPDRGTVLRDGRRIGTEIALTGAYRGDWASLVRAYDDAAILDTLFAPSWVEDVSKTRVADASILLHYASTGGAPAAEAQYIVQASGMAPPPGTTRIATRNDVALHVRDTVQWRAEQADVPAVRPANRWYAIPRTTLFRHLGRPIGVHQMDLVEFARRFLPGRTR